MVWRLQDLPRRQIFYERAVRFEEVEFEQFVPFDPPDFAKDPVLNLALVFMHFEESQFHRPPARVLVMDADDSLPMVASMPSSSSNSRRKASRGCSPSSILTPGNSYFSGIT